VPPAGPQPLERGENAVFETLIESRADQRSFWRPRIVALAFALHAAVLGMIWMRHFFQIPSIPEPSSEVTFARFTPPPPPPAPAPPKPAAPKPVVKPPTPMPKELVQPEKTPDVVTTTPVPEPEPSTAPAGGVEGGVEGGVPGGVAGGVPSMEPLRVGGDVAPPEILQRLPKPEYPTLARNARIEGIVILEAVIRSDGTVGNIKILRDLPLGCGQAAVEAVRQWRFKPGTLKGVPVDVYYSLTVSFRLG
jgi:protein TonB